MASAKEKAKGLKDAYVGGIVEGAREAVGGSPLGGYGQLSGQDFPTNGSGLGVAEQVIGRDPQYMGAAGNPGLGARGALGAQAFDPSAPDVMGAARYDLSARPALGQQDFNPNSPDVMGASRYNLGARAALDAQAFDPNAPNLGVSATQGIGPVADGAAYGAMLGGGMDSRASDAGIKGFNQTSPNWEAEQRAYGMSPGDSVVNYDSGKGVARAKVKGGMKAAANADAAYGGVLGGIKAAGAADYRGAAGNPDLSARPQLGVQGFDPNVARML